MIMMRNSHVIVFGLLCLCIAHGYHPYLMVIRLKAMCTNAKCSDDEMCLYRSREPECLMYTDLPDCEVYVDCVPKEEPVTKAVEEEKPKEEPVTIAVEEEKPTCIEPPLISVLSSLNGSMEMSYIHIPNNNNHCKIVSQLTS